MYTDYVLLFKRWFYRRDFGDLYRQDNFKSYSRTNHNFMYFLLHYWLQEIETYEFGVASKRKIFISKHVKSCLAFVKLKYGGIWTDVDATVRLPRYMGTAQRLWMASTCKYGSLLRMFLLSGKGSSPCTRYRRAANALP
jgi:hypothetical protein